MPSAIDKFKNANTKFADRGERLEPIYRTETDDKGVTKQVYDSTGNYRVKILRVYWKSARAPKRGEYYLVDVEVLTSNNPKIPVGSKRTWMQTYDNDVGPTACTDFMLAAAGIDRRDAAQLAEIKKLEEEGELPKMLAETLDDPSDPLNCKNSLKDAIVDVEVKEIITKTKQEKFKLHTWFPVKDAA